MTSKTWLVGMVAVGVFGGALLSAACGADPAPAPGNAGSDLNDSASTNGTDPKTPTPSSAPSSAAASGPSPAASTGGTSGAAPTGSGDEACAAQAEDACYTCCSNNHPTGSDASDTAEAACLCVPTRCATQCATSSYCSDSDNAPDPKPGDACDTCIKQFENDDGTGDCDKAIAAAGQAAGGDQAAFVACENNCP